MCLKSIPLAYQIDFFCIYIYMHLGPDSNCHMCNSVDAKPHGAVCSFLSTFRHFSISSTMSADFRPDSDIFAIPVAPDHNTQQCATMHQIHVFNLHVESPHEQNPNTFQVGIPDNVDIVNCKQFAAIQECNEALNRCILQTKIL